MGTGQANFNGLRVAAFESRRAEEMARMIERSGGVPHVSPSMREVPLKENPAAIDFANQLITGQLDIVIFMTGVGFRHLVAAVERRVDRARYLHALADIVTIARGPKPVAAMKEVGLTPTYRVPEPNTWRELLAMVDEKLSIANQRVGLQEYGQTNPSLIAGLEARGAQVINLKVYQWDLPEDTQPLAQNIRKLADCQLDVAMFTSAHQVVNLMSLATCLGLADQVRAGLRHAVVASIGPTTSEMLEENAIPVDLVPSHPKMGHLIQEAAEQAGRLLERKRQVRTVLSAPAAEGLPQRALWHDSRFLRACRREPCDTTPIWLMRQAGRYLPEYRKIREKTSFLELCKDPPLCSEIMVKAVQQLGVDAAIIFSDLLPILEPMGLELEYSQGEGPVIHNPVRQSGDVDRVLELENADQLQFVTETVRQTRRDLPEAIPLIGFAGAPFTLASYVIEGGASRNYLLTKTLMYRDEGAWRALMERLARAVTLYLNAQISAGAQCVQLFDSWVGCLGPDDYRRYVLPFVTPIVSGLSAGVPLIHFAAGNPALLACVAEAGSAVVGVDWRIPLDQAWQTVGYDRAIQGNLDPAALLAETAEIRRRANEILDQAAGRPGHIFNLGHGVLPQTPVDNVVALVEAVHEMGYQQ
jgi:uroporphyrinogen decarboxylase